MQETWVQFLGREDPLEEGMATTPVFLPGESHGQRSLAGCSPWGLTESDTAEGLSAHCTALANRNAHRVELKVFLFTGAKFTVWSEGETSWAGEF